MAFTNDSFATMLLCVALSPNREEYARPYGVQEFARLMEQLRVSGLQGPGDLQDMDILELMQRLQISEEEAYRIYTLLNRSVQMNYALEAMLMRGVSPVTMFDEGYPRRLREKMKAQHPPFYYCAGAAGLSGKPAVAIVGISGVKTDAVVRSSISALVQMAAQADYGIITGGELGVSRVAADAVVKYGGTLIEVLAGGLYEHLEEKAMQALLRQDRLMLISLEHPEALVTGTHCIARNKVLFSLAEAAFIFNTDNKRGEMDALNNRYCDQIYAWNGWMPNRQLISRGAIPFSTLQDFDFEALQRTLHRSHTEQVSMFDLL